MLKKWPSKDGQSDDTGDRSDNHSWNVWECDMGWDTSQEEGGEYGTEAGGLVLVLGS